METAHDNPSSPTVLPRLLERGWFYLALAAAFLAGWFAPGVGLTMDRVGMMPYVIAFTFLLNGFTLPTEHLVGNLRQWPLLAAALVNTFIVPLLAVALVLRLLPPGGDAMLRIGFLMLAVMPTTLVSAVVLTRTACGNGALALYITVLGNVLAVFIVPLLMRFSLHSLAGREIALGATILSLIYTVLLPTIGGQLLRLVAHRWADRHRRALGITAQLVILLFVLDGMAKLPHNALSPALWGGVLLAAVLLHLLLLVTAEGGGRLLKADVTSRRALLISSSEKSLAVAVALNRQLFAGGGLVLFPSIVYYVAVLVIDNILAQHWGRKSLAEIEPATGL